jgi:hypothetical protein
MDNVKLFGFEWPDFAGALVYCMTLRWEGQNVVHLNDSASQDRYLDMLDKTREEGWKNVWPDVAEDWMEERGYMEASEEYDNSWGHVRKVEIA